MPLPQKELDQIPEGHQIRPYWIAAVKTDHVTGFYCSSKPIKKCPAASQFVISNAVTQIRDTHVDLRRIFRIPAANLIEPICSVPAVVQTQANKRLILQHRQNQTRPAFRFPVPLVPAPGDLLHSHGLILDCSEQSCTIVPRCNPNAESAVGGRIHPLARKVVCSCCGCIMEQTGRPPRADGTRIRYVRCRMHQRAPEVCGNKTCTNLTDLQNVVLQRIRAYVSDWFDPEKVKLPEQDDPVRQRNQAMREELRKLRGDVERRRKAMQELYLDKVSGLIDSAQFFEMNKSFLDEVSSAEARIEKLESELEQQKEESATIQTQMQRVRELAQVSHLTRELAVLLVDRVVVGPKDARTGEQKITIEWNF